MRGRGRAVDREEPPPPGRGRSWPGPPGERLLRRRWRDRGRGGARPALRARGPLAPRGGRGRPGHTRPGQCRQQRRAVLAPLEHPPPLVVCDDLVELLLLVAPVVEVVALDLLAEGGLDELAAFPQLQRLAQRRGEGFGLGSLVGVPLQLWTGVDPLLDPVEPR